MLSSRGAGCIRARRACSLVWQRYTRRRRRRRRRLYAGCIGVMVVICSIVVESSRRAGTTDEVQPVWRCIAEPAAPIRALVRLAPLTWAAPLPLRGGRGGWGGWGAHWSINSRATPDGRAWLFAQWRGGCGLPVQLAVTGPGAPRCVRRCRPCDFWRPSRSGATFGLFFAK